MSSRCLSCSWTGHSPSDSCPQCGIPLSMLPVLRAEASGAFIGAYLRLLRKILLKPKAFFHEMRVSEGLGRPLAFALITHWLGSMFGFLWDSLFRTDYSGFNHAFYQFAERLSEQVSRGREWMEFRSRFSDWFWGTGAVILDPFLTLIAILFTAFFVFVGARILVDSEHMRRSGGLKSVSYESAVRIVAYGMTPSILGAIPWAGWLIVPLYTLVLTVVGAKETYRVGTGRAIVIALFPRILMFGLAFLAIMALVLGIVALFTMAVR